MNAEQFLEREGYRRCDIPACNCGSYHRHTGADTRDPVSASSEKLSGAARALVEQWRNSHAHTYASENADLYRGFDNGCRRCADQLEAVLSALLAQAGGQGGAGFVVRAQLPFGKGVVCVNTPAELYDAVRYALGACASVTVENIISEGRSGAQQSRMVYLPPLLREARRRTTPRLPPRRHTVPKSTVKELTHA